MFYRSQCCSGKHLTLSADDTPKLNKATIETLIKSIFDGNDPDKKTLFNDTLKVFAKGVTEGYRKSISKAVYNSPDFLMLNELQYNVAVFAAFKNHTNINELVKLLRDEEGKLRKWADFKAEALKLDEKFNVQWLKVEYNQAVTSARAARKWQDIQRTKNLYPHLEYIAVNDDRTRPLHRKWHGIILPIDHAFWDNHYPPNDYGCRCTARRTDKAIDTKGYNVDDMPKLPAQFNQNVGKTGKVFNQDHPYFEIDQYKAVAKLALNSYLRWQNKSIFSQLQNTFTKPLKTEIGKVNITNKALKEALNQPHKKAYLKNNLVLKLEEVLKDAYYVNSVASTKANDYYQQYHYLRLKDYRDMIVVLREDPKGGLFFYSIVDNIKL